MRAIALPFSLYNGIMNLADSGGIFPASTVCSDRPIPTANELETSINLMGWVVGT